MAQHKNLPTIQAFSVTLWDNLELKELSLLQPIWWSRGNSGFLSCLRNPLHPKTLSPLLFVLTLLVNFIQATALGSDGYREQKGAQSLKNVSKGTEIILECL